MLTADNDWDPSVADCDFSDSAHWYDALETHEGLTYNEPFDSNGRHAVKANWHNTHQYIIEDEFDPVFQAQALIQKPSEKDYESYRKYFLFSPLEVIRKTFAATTQYAHSGWITGYIYNTHQAPFPTLNVA